MQGDLCCCNLTSVPTTLPPPLLPSRVMPLKCIISSLTSTKYHTLHITHDTGHEGLKACAKQLAAYETCMSQSSVSNKTVSKMFRVQEEYRSLPMRVGSEK